MHDRPSSLWRLHSSVHHRALACDFFEPTAAKGRGAGESLAHFPTRDGDRVLAGRGYSTAAGLHRVVSSGVHLTVRVNTGALPLRTTDGAPFDLLTAVGTLKRAGAVRSWPRGGGRGWHRGGGGARVRFRKTQEAIRSARRKLREGGDAQRQADPTATPGVRARWDRLRHLPRTGLHRLAGSGAVPRPLTGRTALQALQVAGAVGACAEIRRRQRQGVALRHAPGRPAGGKADPS